ncbi:uncharacterized protein FIBRA_08869 [Fibroporia radiculosa]|uniref:C2H2-type domain-containing protein n=1 Tax=Fibroporia radiculosa TaxID=599839 RepID=J4ICK9_9APHY|nr:uncharacterized protein FIBRA_08869 [Fibroporia radiculosa]CCM06591.1 predicted protein [Fibroporia radiculosa]
MSGVLHLSIPADVPGGTVSQGGATEDEEFGDDGEEDYEDDYADGDDLEAEAEEMARILKEQLQADIAKAQLEAAAAHQPRPTLEKDKGNTDSTSTARKRRYEAALSTMKAIMSIASKRALVHDSLAAFLVPAAENANILTIFQRCISSEAVPKKLARPLSDAVVLLAKSDILFASLRNSDAPALQLDKGKRKRDAADEVAHDYSDSRGYKRFAYDYPDLRFLISEAVRVITNALATVPSGPASPHLDPALISSIHVQLHQVFLFAVTSAPRAGERMPALQELAGLIQMLGVLSGIPIGSNPSAPLSHPHSPWGHPYGAPSTPDLGTAVYPCLIPTCAKVFHRLYSLRAHQRLHSFVERPYRCTQCPASFVRNHDLKRHTKLHDKQAWRCSGCSKVFSRRDAIKRHKDSRGRIGGKGKNGEIELGDNACAYAEIEEVEVEKPQGDEEASRRAKLWNDITTNHMGSAPPGHVNASGDEFPPEEGEVEFGVVGEAHSIVLQLHGLLQVYVAKLLGTTSASEGQAGVSDPSTATLASIIARTQYTQPQSRSVSVQPQTPSVYQSAEAAQPPDVSSPQLSLSLSLSEEQTRLLEQAIAQAALAAQAQAEAEAALEEEAEASDEDGHD